MVKGYSKQKKKKTKKQKMLGNSSLTPVAYLMTYSETGTPRLNERRREAPTCARNLTTYLHILNPHAILLLLHLLLSVSHSHQFSASLSFMCNLFVWLTSSHSHRHHRAACVCVSPSLFCAIFCTIFIAASSWQARDFQVGEVKKGDFF